MPGRVLLPKVLPLMLTTRPSDAIFISTLVVVVVVVVLVVPFTVIFKDMLVTATDTSAVPLESTDFTVRVSFALMSMFSGIEKPCAPTVYLNTAWKLYLYVSPALYAREMACAWAPPIEPHAATRKNARSASRFTAPA